KTASGQYRLQQKPLVEYQALRDNANAVSDNNRSLDNNSFVYNSASKSYEIVVKFSLKTASEAGFKIHKGDENYALVGYQKAGKKIFIDRTHLGGNVPAYLQRSEFAIPDIDNSNVELHIFVDRNTIEVFAGDYRIAGTAMIFPCENCTDLEMYATGGAATADVQIFPLKSIWNENFTNGISSVYFNSDEISLKQIDKKLFKVINIENGSARFFDLSGRLIKRFPIINPESIIDLSDVDSGIFLLNIISGSKNKTFKINLV
ncbi:MAG: GH32 C-terminal domain-containing protein, partial [Prevotellaceae bacterium]|nr:GH32 C-terminal domain-containing protein [Prevotellaceae bacterium]